MGTNPARALLKHSAIVIISVVPFRPQSDRPTDRRIWAAPQRRFVPSSLGGLADPDEMTYFPFVAAAARLLLLPQYRQKVLSLKYRVCPLNYLGPLRVLPSQI